MRFFGDVAPMTGASATPVLKIATVYSSFYGVEKGALVVHRRFVTRDVGRSQRIQHGAYVPVLVFDRAWRTINHVLQCSIVCFLDDNTACHLDFEHVEIVCHDGFNFLRGPRCASGRLHLAAPIAMWLALRFIHLRFPRE